MISNGEAGPGRAFVGALALAAWLAAVGTADARPIHYGAVDDPAVLACDRLHWRGRTEESGPCYAALLDNASDPAVRAEAAWALNDRHAANGLYRRAVEAAPGDAALRIRWGDLYAASHQNADAIGLYREALERDADNAFARLGIARVLIASFDPAADDVLASLVDDPLVGGGARAVALMLTARAALESGNIDTALIALDEAGTIVVRDDWPPLDVYALRAAADLIDGTDTGPWTADALAYNPRWGEIYATPAHFYVITRRYREAIDLYQQAVDIEPGLAAAHEQLGINLLRDNQLSRARRHLEIAYAEDPFSPRAVNTLRLLDSFTNFRLIEDLPESGGEMPVVLRLHEDEADAIAPYAIELARRSIAEFSGRYGFDLREPVIIEMYPDHEDFAVRTAGMPGIGILGATFGYVVAMDSPSARPPREYQWGTTLWHEMAHVFTLEATDHLVPRWFSEGISVHEEWRSGPNPGIRLPIRIYTAMDEDVFLPIGLLDEGFIRPEYEDQVFVSYMQAGLVCDYIERNWGIDGLRGLLDAFGDGLETAAAIQTVLGVAPERFDEMFAAHIDSTHGETIAALPQWQALRGDAVAAFEAEDWDAVIRHAGPMVDILPQYVEPDSPYLLLARAHEQLGDDAAALDALERFWTLGGYEPDALGRLADALDGAGRNEDAIRALAAINLVDPLDLELHHRLGTRLLEAGRAADALRELEIALALDPHDKAAVWYQLARAHESLGQRDAAQQSLLEALDIAPGYRPAQRLLLELAGN